MVGVQLIPLSGVLPGAGARTTNGHSSAAVADSPFVAGGENLLVATAIEQLLAKPGAEFNPLVLYGPPGVGKSHLAAGLAEVWHKRFGGAVVHTNGTDFARGYAAAVENEAVSEWRTPICAAGLFVLENLMQMSTKRGALEELVATLDELIAHGRQAVITSRLPPSEVRGFPATLVSRLTGGLLISVSPPGPESRRMLAQRLAQARKLAIEPAALRILADACPATVPEMHAAICELQMSVETSQGSKELIITAATMRQFVGQRTTDVKPTVRGITSLTAKYFSLKSSDLTSPSRRRAVVVARGIALYLARQLTGKSLEQLGTHFGGRDHTTVLHSYRSTELRLQRDPEVRLAVDHLRKQLASS